MTALLIRKVVGTWFLCRTIFHFDAMLGLVALIIFVQNEVFG